MILRTGHIIADTVAEALEQGYGQDVRQANVPIGYGILRGTAEIFKEAQTSGGSYIHLDNGYFNPGHFDGYYRISKNGTQQTDFTGLEPDYERLAQLNLDIKPWRGFDKSKPILIIPPTEHVKEFFNLDFGEDDFEISIDDFPKDSVNIIGTRSHKCLLPYFSIQKPVIRQKSDTSPIDFNDYNYVLTFNSSMGWKVLQAGIPCVSDTTYSMVGSYYNNISLDDLEQAQYDSREQLFGLMASLQFTLQEIRDGKACNLISKFSSGMTAEKLSVQAS